MTRRKPRRPAVTRCRGKNGLCRLPLSDPTSVALGYGPTCWEREHPDLVVVKKLPTVQVPAVQRGENPAQLELALFEADEPS